MLRRAHSLSRRRRGIALVATVVLTIMAAAVVLVITTQSITASRTASNQSDASVASQAVADTQRSIETWLEQDPYAFFTSVSPYEDARVCADGTTYQPGAAWSVASCGTSWTYQNPTNLNSAGTQNSSSTLNIMDSAIVQAHLQPPTAASPFLQITITSQYGQYNAGLTLTYRMAGSEEYTVFSSTDLHLDNLASGCSSSCSSLTGSLYTDGTMFLPTSSGVSTGPNTQLESEGGFSPAPSSSSAARYYSPSPSESTSSVDQIGDIRTVTPSQLTLATLRAATARNTKIACPGSNPFAYASDGALSSLCLNSGLTIPALYAPADSGAGNVTIPSGVTAYLLVFNDSAQTPHRPDTVAVYYATTPISPAGNCIVSCNLLSVSAGDVAANQSPGEYSFWSPNLLGVFSVPRSGLIYSPSDTYLSLCGSASSNAAWASYGSSCPSISAGSSAAGMTVGQSATIIAGSASSPANIYLSGSINTAPGVSFGAIASGSVIVPYWSHSPGTTVSSDLNISGAYTALGYDSTSGVGVETFPTSVDTTVSDNVGRALNLTGSLAGPGVDLSFNMFSKVALQGSAQLSSAPPPYFSDFSGSWSLVNQATLPTVVKTGS